MMSTFVTLGHKFLHSPCISLLLVKQSKMIQLKNPISKEKVSVELLSRETSSRNERISTSLTFLLPYLLSPSFYPLSEMIKTWIETQKSYMKGSVHGKVISQVAIYRNSFPLLKNSFLQLHPPFILVFIPVL